MVKNLYLKLKAQLHFLYFLFTELEIGINLIKFYSFDMVRTNLIAVANNPSEYIALVLVKENVLDQETLKNHIYIIASTGILFDKIANGSTVLKMFTMFKMNKEEFLTCELFHKIIFDYYKELKD